jgi:hypothetical protein
MPSKKDYDYYYNAARKEEEEKETPEEKAKYKLDKQNEKIWNIYRYVYAPDLRIRDIVDQQDISVVRAYQIVLDYGGIERLQQARDYNEVNDEIKQENMSKLEQTTLNLGKGIKKTKRKTKGKSKKTKGKSKKTKGKSKKTVGKTKTKRK